MKTLHRTKNNANGWYYGLIADHATKTYIIGNSQEYNFRQLSDIAIITTKKLIFEIEKELIKQGFTKEVKEN